MKLFLPGLLIILCCISGFSQQQEVLKEKVRVVNVEVPVRVFLKGKPVKTLKKSDFRLYEDGRLQKINGFVLKRKKVNVQNIKLKVDSKLLPPRYFVLIFKIRQYNQGLVKGINHFFDKILRKTDSLLVMVNEKSIYWDNLSGWGSVRERIMELLKEQGNLFRKHRSLIYRKIEREVDHFKIMLEIAKSTKDPQIEMIIKTFLNKYLRLWYDFKNDHITPDIDKFYNFANHLEKIKLEKWVFNFYQEERFPMIKRDSQEIGFLVNMLDSREYDKLNQQFKAETDFPVELITKLFYKVNATFFSILIPTMDSTVSNDIENKSISTALENSLREVTKRTGGMLLSTSNLIKALDTMIEKEDYYYVLNYEPLDADRISKIKVRIDNDKKGYKLRYDNNIRADYINEYLRKKKLENPEIRINKIELQEKNLRLVVNDFLLKKDKKLKQGLLNLRVRVEDGKGNIVFDQSQKLEPQKKPVIINTDLNALLKDGEYYITVDVMDKFTGNSDLDLVHSIIKQGSNQLSRVDYSAEQQELQFSKELTPKKEEANELQKYLSGAAGYCQRLKQVLFNFYCREKIVETLEEIPFKNWEFVSDISLYENKADYANVMKQQIYQQQPSLHKVNKFRFDYQLIKTKDKIYEQRKGLSKKSKLLAKDKINRLIQSFLSERCIFGPLTMLSREKQGRFKFNLLGYKSEKKRRYAVIETSPRENVQGDFSYGKLWVDTEDFSVKRIQVNPASIRGFEKLTRLARKLNAMLILKCQIEYGKKYQGILYPTRINISETYKGGPLIIKHCGHKGWERSKTTVVYDKYRFFNVDMKVKEEIGDSPN